MKTIFFSVDVQDLLENYIRHNRKNSQTECQCGRYMKNYIEKYSFPESVISWRSQKKYTSYSLLVPRRIIDALVGTKKPENSLVIPYLETQLLYKLEQSCNTCDQVDQK